MNTEQDGAPPASAGGAPAPDPIGTVRAVDGVLFVLCNNPDYGRRWVPVEGGGQYEDGEQWRQDSRRVVGPVPGTPAARDPRDAELTQLRTALARYQKRLGDDLLCGGKLVERVRAALRVDDGGTCTRASMDGVVGDVGRLCDETERLHGEVFSSNVTLGRVVNRVARALDVTPPGDVEDLVGRIQLVMRERNRALDANSGLAKERDLFVAERDQARAKAEELETQHARNIRELIVERDRLRRRREDEADERLALYGGLVNRIREALHEDAQVETANVGALSNEILRLVHAFEQREGYAAERDDYANRLRETDRAYTKVTAERDRLRQELDLIGEQPPVKVAVERDVMATALVTIRTVLTDVDRRLSAKPAEPRRWVAGDPEPEVGTTVGCGDGNYYTRRDDGIWYRSSDSAGHSWTWLTGRPAHLPLVEVVSTDGD